MKKTDPSVVQIIIDLRKAGRTREQIQAETGFTIGRIKNVLLKNNILLPMDQRQVNAYAGKLAKNPNAMVDMRKGLTEEVVTKRSEAIRIFYAGNEEVAKAASIRMRAWFKENPKERKYDWSHVKEACAAQGFQLLEDTTTPWTEEALKTMCHCGTHFTPNVHDLIYGAIRSCGCVKSYQEKKLLQLLQTSFPDAHSTREAIAPYELDIYIPSKGLAIEYCGLWAHGERIKKDRARSHLTEKMLACQTKGIRLITLYSDEWFDRQEQVVGFINSVLGLGAVTIGARETMLTHSTQTIINFIDTNHIIAYKGNGTTYSVGLEHDGQMVAAMAFKGNQMIRYCMKAGYKVPGAFEKLLTAFAKDNPDTKDVITFSDNRWSAGQLYIKQGFELIKDVAPSYWYTKKACDTKRFHKANYRKEKIEASLGPLLPNETEWEAMQRFGFDRIWDCGLKKWKKVL